MRVAPPGRPSVCTRCATQHSWAKSSPASSCTVARDGSTRGITASSGASEAIAQRMADEGEQFRAMLGSPEAREAFSAFLQKRKPDFSQFG